MRCWCRVHGGCWVIVVVNGFANGFLSGVVNGCKLRLCGRFFGGCDDGFRSNVGLLCFLLSFLISSLFFDYRTAFQ